MFEDDGDIDDNGIPDSIQRDPVVEPGEPRPFSMYDAELPGINAPIESTAAQLPEAPVAPTPPPDDADEETMTAYQRTMMEYQEAMARHRLLVETMTNISNTRHEMLKGIANNLRG